MARPNYSQGKRQRELAQKQKREEKMQRRLEKRKNPGAVVDDGSNDPPVNLPLPPTDQQPDPQP